MQETNLHTILHDFAIQNDKRIIVIETEANEDDITLSPEVFIQGGKDQQRIFIFDSTDEMINTWKEWNRDQNPNIYFHVF